MQADFMLFVRADLNPAGDKWTGRRWWPDTLIYAFRHHGPFEVIARPTSLSEYLEQHLKYLLVFLQSIRREEDER